MYDLEILGDRYDELQEALRYDEGQKAKSIKGVQMIRFDSKTLICEIKKTVVTPLINKMSIHFKAQSSCDLFTFSMENQLCRG